MRSKDISYDKSRMRLSLIEKRNKIKDILQKKESLNKKLLKFLKD